MNGQTSVNRAVWWSGLVVGVVGVLGAGVGIWWNSQQAIEVTEQTLQAPAVRVRTELVLPSVPLTEIAASSGIDFVHNNGAYGAKLLPETMGGGCGFLDFDNDGDQDLLLVNSQPWDWAPDTDSGEAAVTSALYENDGTGSFRNVTAGSGLDVSLYGMGCGFGDYDGDGLTDIYLTCVGPNKLFRNLGGGKFGDVTAAAGVAGGADDWGTSCGWFDYDSDGDLDLFVCNYVEWSREYDQSQAFQLTGDSRAYGRPQSFGGTVPLLFENRGDGTFTEVAEQAGLWVINPATSLPVAKSLGVLFVDVDGDDDLDIIVANDTVPNFLFENQGDKTFREIGTAAGIAFDAEGNARGAMGMDFSAFRNGAAVGIAIGNFSNEMTALYVAPNRICSFTDEAVSNGLGPQTRLALTFGVAFADVDLDGRPDFVAANGHLENEIHRVLPSQTYAQSPHLFWNAGPESPTEFVPFQPEQLGSEFFEPIVGRGCCYGDIDADGDLDLLLTGLHGPPRLFRNDQQTGHHWLTVKVIGRPGQTEAIGARVTLKTGDRIQERIVQPTRGYLSQSQLPIMFGLADSKTITRLEIVWPSGEIVQLSDVAVNQRLEVRIPD